MKKIEIKTKQDLINKLTQIYCLNGFNIDSKTYDIDFFPNWLKDFQEAYNFDFDIYYIKKLNSQLKNMKSDYRITL